MKSAKAMSDDLLKAVRKYTAKHEELRRSHHFLFNLPHCNIDDVEFLIIGQNPGMSADDRACAHIEFGLEETHVRDYRRFRAKDKDRRHRDDYKWSKYISEILATKNFAQSERFFWSSRDLNDFKKLYGCSLSESKHLKFCAEMNDMLLTIYDPKAVLCVGLSGLEEMRQLHGLQETKNKVLLKYRDGVESSQRLLITLKDSKARNWFFVPNFLGARGFSNEDRNEIKKKINRILKSKTQYTL